VERAAADLRYGTVALNCWAGFGFALGVTTWGAFPGHTSDDLQSGTGVVHNTLMFARPEKTVLRAPFRVRPAPAWFATRTGYAELSRKVAEYEALRSPWKLPGLMYAALRG